MKILMASFLLFLNLASYANNYRQIQVSDLAVGDVLLLSLNCMQCRYIESETNSLFSHSGIVLEVGTKVLVGQALQNVHLVEIEKFLKHKTPNSQVIVLRSREFGLNQNIKQLKKYFHQYFENLAFDGEYLWNNRDSFGREKIYCSELIHKLFNLILEKKLTPEVLSYQKHYEYWKQVFRGTVPENEVGNSPASLFRDNENFEIIGHLP